jgi:hypothetical protein
MAHLGRPWRDRVDIDCIVFGGYMRDDTRSDHGYRRQRRDFIGTALV